MRKDSVTHMSKVLVERHPRPAQFPHHLHLLRHLVPFLVTLESERLDDMTPVMHLAVFKIRHELLEVDSAGLERATRGEMKVSDDFVHFDATCDTTAFPRLRLDGLGPVFGDALSDSRSGRRFGSKERRALTCSIESGFVKLQPRFKYACLTSSQLLQHPFSGSWPP